MDAMSRPGLLNLPPELMDLSLNFIGTEMLPAIRLTCKAMDDATFDRFVEVHFANTHCWILTPAAMSRLDEILKNSPKLRTRIRRLTLTDNVLEDQPTGALHVVRRHDEGNDDYGIFFMQIHLRKAYEGSFPLALTHRVLNDVQMVNPNIKISVDLSHHGGTLRERHTDAYAALLFLLAISGTSIDCLTIDDWNSKNVEDLLVHARAGFLASISTIKFLTCIGRMWWRRNGSTQTEESEQTVLVEILGSIKRLRHLSFDVAVPSYGDELVGRVFGMLRVPPEVLSANGLSCLESLALKHVSIAEEDLVRVLTRCRSTLTRLALRRVALLSANEWWRRVGELMLAMPALAFVELQMVYTRDDPSGTWSVRVTTLNGGDPPGVRLEGRNDVVKGLQELSNIGLAFFERLR
jgi:hypothetical protein